jgi:hypothetical protein
MLIGKPTRSAVEFDQFCFMFQMKQMLKMPAEDGVAWARTKAFRL